MKWKPVTRLFRKLGFSVPRRPLPSKKDVPVLVPVFFSLAQSSSLFPCLLNDVGMSRICQQRSITAWLIRDHELESLFPCFWPGRLLPATRWRYTLEESGIFRAFSMRLSTSTACSLLHRHSVSGSPMLHKIADKCQTLDPCLREDPKSTFLPFSSRQRGPEKTRHSFLYVLVKPAEQ